MNLKRPDRLYPEQNVRSKAVKAFDGISGAGTGILMMKGRQVRVPGIMPG